MKSSVYEKLQSDFKAIALSYREGSLDKEICDEALASIKCEAKAIRKSSTPQKHVLIYCINTLFDVLNEGNPQKIIDYAQAIQNIPEMYMGLRNLYSFRAELKKFQKKYGKHYFPFIDKVAPHFSKKAPKNKWEFFSAASDIDFKRLHPVGYTWLCLVGIFALMLPQVLYIAYCVFINPCNGDWTLMIGYVGAFAMGVGLFNIVAAWIHQYLGHLLTVICLLGGGALVALSLVLLYS